MTTGYRFTRPATRRRLARILELLHEHPQGLTRLQLAEMTSINDRAMKRYLGALRGQLEGMPRQIRVREWRRQLGVGGHYVAVFAIGVRPDTSKPTPEPGREATARYRKNLLREKPDQYVAMLMRRRAIAAAKRPPRRDVAAVAIFGAAA